MNKFVGLFFQLMVAMGLSKHNSWSFGSNLNRSKKRKQNKYRDGKPVELTKKYFRDEHGCIRRKGSVRKHYNTNSIKFSELSKGQATGRFYPAMMRYALTKAEEENKRLKELNEIAKEACQEQLNHWNETSDSKCAMWCQLLIENFVSLIETGKPIVPDLKKECSLRIEQALKGE